MIYIVIFIACFGALPLVVFLVKRKRYRSILANGVRTEAQIMEVRNVSTYRGPNYDRVYFAYLPKDSASYFSGLHLTSFDEYKVGDKLEIYYLPDKPAKYAIPGSKGEKAMLIFLIAIFLFSVFAAYKIWEMTKDMNFRFTGFD